MMDGKYCVVCGEVKKNKKSLVEDPSLEDVKRLISHAKSLVDGGNTKYVKLSNYHGADDAETKNLRYHRECRFSVMKLKLKRPAAESDDNKTPIKHRFTQPQRTSLRSPDCPAPKERKCLFVPHFCKWEGKDTLHKVSRDGRGKELIEIKKFTSDNIVRSALSALCYTI